MSSRFIFNMLAGPNQFIKLYNAARCFTVKNGSQDYVKKISNILSKHIRTNSEVIQVVRLKIGNKNKVLVKTTKGEELYDHCLFACSAKIASILLKEKTKKEI